MSLVSAALYRKQLETAKTRHEQGGGRNAYLADCGYVASHMLATAIASSNPAMKHLPKAVMAAQHGIKAAFEVMAERLDCPVECEHDPESYLGHFWSHAEDYVRRDLDSVHDIFKKLGIAR